MSDGLGGVGTSIRRAPGSHPNGPGKELGDTGWFYLKDGTHS